MVGDSPERRRKQPAGDSCGSHEDPDLPAVGIELRDEVGSEHAKDNKREGGDGHCQGPYETEFESGEPSHREAS